MLATRAGLDLAQAYEVIRASSGTSFVHETEGQVILNGSYDIGFTLDLALKDLGARAALGAESRCPARARRATSRRFGEARERYGGDAWSPMVVRLLEDALGVDLRAPGFPATLELLRLGAQARRAARPRTSCRPGASRAGPARSGPCARAPVSRGGSTSRAGRRGRGAARRGCRTRRSRSVHPASWAVVRSRTQPSSSTRNQSSSSVPSHTHTAPDERSWSW